MSYGLQIPTSVEKLKVNNEAGLYVLSIDVVLKHVTAIQKNSKFKGICESNRIFKFIRINLKRAYL